jgi:hypothetical protein
VILVADGNGLDSDEGSCRDNRTDVWTSIDCLPVSSPCCTKAAGIRRLLLEVQRLLVGPGFAKATRYAWVFVYWALEYISNRTPLCTRQDMPSWR